MNAAVTGGYRAENAENNQKSLSNRFKVRVIKKYTNGTNKEIKLVGSSGVRTNKSSTALHSVQKE